MIFSRIHISSWSDEAHTHSSAGTAQSKVSPGLYLGLPVLRAMFSLVYTDTYAYVFTFFLHNFTCHIIFVLVLFSSHPSNNVSKQTSGN